VEEGEQVSDSDLAAIRQQLADNVANLSVLRADLGRLKEKLPAIPSWLTITGVVFGILSAIVGVLVGLHSFFWKLPRLSAVAGPTLALRYLPQMHELSVGWTFSVWNDGDLSNVVSDEAGEIDDSADASKKVVVFSPTEIDCTTGQAKVWVPFDVGQGLPVSVTCTADGFLSDKSRSMLSDGSPKKFKFSLKGQRRTSSNLEYCFDLPDREIDDLRSGTRAVSIRFVYSSCSAGAK
jgi:hypothetical protein